MTKIKCAKCGFTNPAGQQSCTKCGSALPQIRIQQGVGNQPPRSAQPYANITFQPGQLVARRYTIVDIVGRGGMGCIYKVYDNTLKEEVALKTLLPQFLRDKLVVDRFFNEARIARQLSHPNIVRVHDIGIAEQILYISMEYLQGKSLRSMIDEKGPGERIPVKQTLEIMVQLCNALEYAHQYTVHRDIKPENVMLLGDGTVKLMDFGISKLMSNQQLTATSVIMGTPHYMSPEQLKDSRNVDARADVYSIGVMLYEILTGNLPTGVPKPASQIMKDIPPALDPIVARCVEPDPIDRYQNVSDLKQAFTSVLDLIKSGGTLQTGKGGTAARKENEGVVRRAIGAGIIAATVLLTGIGVWAMEVKARSDAVDAEAQRNAQPGAASPEETRLNEYFRLLERASTRTMGPQRSETEQAILDQAAALGDAARANAQDDAERAEALARQALQCYIAVLERPATMTFIPPGNEVEQEGFYLDNAPVSYAQYAQFVEQNQWRPLALPAGEAGEGGPITGVTFYDALACASSMDKLIPNSDQWSRAFGAAPELFVPNLYEWTRTPVGEAATGAPIPTFGQQLEIRGAAVDSAESEQPIIYEVTPTALDYHTADAQVGFRCIKPIATDLARVDAQLR